MNPPGRRLAPSSVQHRRFVAPLASRYLEVDQTLLDMQIIVYLHDAGSNPSPAPEKSLGSDSAPGSAPSTYAMKLFGPQLGFVEGTDVRLHASQAVVRRGKK